MRLCRLSSRRPCVASLCQLIVAWPHVVLSLRHSLVVLSCQLVVTSPLDTPPSLCLVVLLRRLSLSRRASWFSHHHFSSSSRCIALLSSHRAGWLLRCLSTANVIAESMYASCNADGNEYILFDSFVHYKSNLKAVTKDNQQIVHNGRNSLRRSTVGWHLYVQWKDGSTSWQSLKDLKETYPIAVAQYAVAQEIDDDPAFNWWVHHVLHKREHIIALVKKRSTRFLKKTHMLGIELP